MAGGKEENAGSIDSYERDRRLLLLAAIAVSLVLLVVIMVAVSTGAYGIPANVPIHTFIYMAVNAGMYHEYKRSTVGRPRAMDVLVFFLFGLPFGVAVACASELQEHRVGIAVITMYFGIGAAAQFMAYKFIQGRRNRGKKT